MPKMIKQLINKYATEYKIEPSIVYGICMQESNLDTSACRYEPNYKWLYKPSEVKPKNSSLITEEIFQKISWGAAQIMGAVLREYGYTGWLPEIILKKDEQIMYCVKHLSVLKKRYPTNNDYISAYNAGNPRKTPSGKYVNEFYVKKVLDFSNKWKLIKDE